MKLKQVNDIRTVFGKGGVLDQLPNPSINNLKLPAIPKIKEVALDAYIWAVKQEECPMIDVQIPIKHEDWAASLIDRSIDNHQNTEWWAKINWERIGKDKSTCSMFCLAFVFNDSVWSLRKIVASSLVSWEGDETWECEKETDPTIQRDIWGRWHLRQK